MEKHTMDNRTGSGKDDANSFSGWVSDNAALISGGSVATFCIALFINLVF